jgi:hypothetical protein
MGLRGFARGFVASSTGSGRLLDRPPFSSADDRAVGRQLGEPLDASAFARSASWPRFFSSTSSTQFISTSIVWLRGGACFFSETTGIAGTVRVAPGKRGGFLRDDEEAGVSSLSSHAIWTSMV